MPRPDPIPSPKASAWLRFRRVMRWMSLVAILAALAAVYLVGRGEPDIKIHVAIATALGAGLSVLLGAALMTLVFISADSGHDEQAHLHRDSIIPEDDQ
jgi:uncharacterized membrane protein